MWDWLSKKTNREIAAIFIPVLVAAIAGAWTVYATLFKPETTMVAHYILCQGQDENSCPTHSDYLPCGASDKDWASDRCKDFGFSQKSDVAGGMCGYRVTDVTCTVKR
jgi:hypothetical protein